MKLRVIHRGRWTVLAACSDRGECALLDFTEQLGPNYHKDRGGLYRLLEKIASEGPQFLPDEICHTIADEIWQLTKGRLRVAWFYDKGEFVICSHGYMKRSGKTKKADIDAALECLKKYRISSHEIIGD